MDVGDLFDHLDRIERKHEPLTPIVDELDADSTYVRSEENTCSVDGCSGDLFKHHETGELICGSCSTVYNSGDVRAPEDSVSIWDHFDRYRPSYNNSARKRQVGGFPTYEWVDSDDLDRPLDELDPSSFYRE